MKSIAVPVADGDPNPIIEFVEENLPQHDCSAKALYQIEVAIEEVFVNIASYAGLADDDSVEVRCEVLDNPLRAVVQFIDEGVPFDPLAADDPDISPEALEARDGGLGIYMVKQMMDEVTYAYKDGKNTLTITKNL